MNKEIKELAVEAKLGAALLLDYWGGVEALTDSEQEDLKRIEKFAELIVKECVGCIDDGRGEASSMAEHGWRQVCQKEIKKHFGVE